MRRASFIWVAMCGCATGGPGAGAAAELARSPLRETRAQLVLHCQPLDAEVVLDEVPYAHCKDVVDKPIALKRGLNHVEVRRAGLQGYQTWVDPDGTQAALQVNLEPALARP